MPSTSRKVALGGVLSVLCIACLYLAVYLPTNRIFFYGLSSAFCAVIMIESGTRWAWIFYGATSILAVLIVPNKLGVIPYVLFFGHYGIVKYYIETIRNIVVEIIIKGILFFIAAGGTAFIVKELFMGEVYSKLPLWILAVIALVVFYIYDYAYTKFVIYYEVKFRKRL